MEVGTFEAKNRLSALLDLVEAGEEVTITRNGKPVAQLVKPRQSRDVEAAQKAVRDILEMRKEVKPDPEGLTIRDYIEMGRRY
ncbi:MAG: type II toxin-antitoxin system prevent-host-death family antitoxin [Rhizobiaceae bacterium]|nr:type II toxin-antitoxin system prevent-host-death family antitoxin [Rhizobiaceae bacterium]